ncbi:hypothetical protein ACN20G_28020 (plasmid) [Streptomyces sp. BI20]|uniref:hypothetical protein n=1 Tax=Streptomyces sp. BI20 TaxID=3403460 RepID=UPI003C775E1B
MSSRTARFFHGGVPGLEVGDVLAGGHSRQVVDGCAICASRNAGRPTLYDPATLHPDRLYVTTDREYARHYAGTYGAGDLYDVVPLGDVLPSEEDRFPTWSVSRARVRLVVARRVHLTWEQRAVLRRRWEAADRAADTAALLALLEGMGGR